jgi:hypothetical protein
MLGRRGVGFDLVLAAVGFSPLAAWGMWYWPWDEGWLSWIGWPAIIAFAACFALARMIGEFYTGWPGLDAPTVKAPDVSTSPQLERPVTFTELATLGLGVAALLAFGWVVTHPQAVQF